MQQKLSELPSLKKMNISEICGEDISAKAIGLVSFENEYLYWLRNVKIKCVHNVASQNCNSCNSVRTRVDRVRQPEANFATPKAKT